MRRHLVVLLCLLLAAALAPAVAQAQSQPLAFAPSGLTTDRFAAVTTPQRVDVTAHDGVALHARVYRPDTSADPAWRTPVILVHSPYYDGLLLGDPERSLDLVSLFTPKGYTVVLSDVRGTGNSGGCGEQDGADQARDFQTLVEHFAAQPWSNGRVGSYGKSFDAETQNAGAIRNPQGLATMVTVAGISGLYDVAYFDGVPLALNGVAPNGVLSAALYETYDLDVPGEPGAMLRRFERGTCQPENFVNGADPSGDMSAYWAEREFRHGVADLTASVLYVQGLSDFTVSPINLDGWYDAIPTFKRAVLGQWAHSYPYDTREELARDDWYATVHAWLDHELLDLPTGIEGWPEVQVQAEDAIWRAVGSFAGLGTPHTLGLGAGTATFTESGTLALDLDSPARHLAGQVHLDTVIALDRPDGHVALTVSELRTDGSTRDLTRGYLSTVHRESLLHQVAVTPGHPTPYRIRTYPFDATLDEGSRLRVTLSGSDAATLPAGTAYTATVDLDRTVLHVPVADDRCGLAVDATADPAPAPLPCPDGVPAPVTAATPSPAGAHLATARVVGTVEEVIAGVPAIREAGYLLVRDGVELAYEVVRPAGDGPFPTLLTYDGYDAGGNPDSGYAERYLPRGWALVGLSLRGTSCSGGVFDFFQPAEGRDGYEMVEWIARQPWSTGRVAMVGKSYPGITQLFVAEQAPPHLVAISPGHFFADAYRDIAFPGGIFNYAFAALWSFVAQPAPGYQTGTTDILGGDATCAQHQRHHAENVRMNPFLQAQEHPFDDLLIAERSPLTHADRIAVPVYTALAWQDEQLMSRQSHFLAALQDLGVPYRAVLSNGDHGTYREPDQLAELDRFLEAHLVQPAQLADGTPLADYLAEPPVTVFWEQGEETGPRWRSALPSWGDQAQPRRLYASSDGTLTTEAPAASGQVTYAHSAAGSQGIAGEPTPGGVQMWGNYAPPPGSAVAFTSTPFEAATVLLGPASADLWLTATAPNVDLQVTLSEIRPDGTEVFVNQGWLRADQRALDAARSTELLPVQRHGPADVAALSPTVPSLARVEVFPSGHVVRAGSRLRLWVEAPTVLPQLQGFAPDPAPAAVTVHTGPATPSSLVLPVTDRAPVPPELAGQQGQPACGVVQRQPCRPDPLAATLRPDISTAPPGQFAALR